MSRSIRKITLILAVFASGISILLFQGNFDSIGVGILIGALVGIIGYNMIVSMVERVDTFGNIKGKVFQSYVRRYTLYTLVFALSTYKGVHIVALLVGFTCLKAALMIYTYLNRKEVD